ncbi:MAG: winged helix-turn-helix domain-containing protein [Candidatus Bathyarchaeia archaeon]
MNLLAHHPYGLSSWDMAKILKVAEQNVRYHLKEMKKKGLIEKSGSRYLFPYEYLIKKGIIITKLVSGFAIFSCPHYHQNCKCSDGEKKNCRYMKELPDMILSRFKE